MGENVAATELALKLIVEGSDLRAKGRLEEARAALREAIAIAERTGAGSIEERARRELSASAYP